MEFEIKNKKLSDDEFYKIREEILSTWETGKDAVDLQAGIDYQKSIPEHKSFSKKLLKEVTSQLFGPSVLFCINGGSYLRDSAMELINGLGYCMHNGYGMTELGITSVERTSKRALLNTASIGAPFTRRQRVICTPAMGSISVPSSQEKPISRSLWQTAGESSSKSALTKARVSPVRIRSLGRRLPSRRLRLSRMMDFPAPVSPVMTENPCEKSISSVSINA